MAVGTSSAMQFDAFVNPRKSKDIFVVYDKYLIRVFNYRGNINIFPAFITFWNCWNDWMLKPLDPATRIIDLVAGIKMLKAVHLVVIAEVVNVVKRYARFKLKIIRGLAIYSSVLVFASIMDLKYSMLLRRATNWAPAIRKFKYTCLNILLQTDVERDFVQLLIFQVELF